MLTLAFWILLLAAVGGVAMAALDIAYKPIRIGHGVIAGVGLVVFLIGAVFHDTALAWTAFACNATGFAAGRFSSACSGMIVRPRACSSSATASSTRSVFFCWRSRCRSDDRRKGRGYFIRRKTPGRPGFRPRHRIRGRLRHG